jgi:hypothetical protein
MQSNAAGRNFGAGVISRRECMELQVATVGVAVAALGKYYHRLVMVAEIGGVLYRDVRSMHRHHAHTASTW